MVPDWVTCSESSRPVKDAVRVIPAGGGECGARGRRRHRPRSRAVRASCLPALRPACEVRRWKWAGQPVHEAWPGSHQGTTHPLGRAVVERRQASAPDSGRGGASRLTPWREPRAVFACGTDDSATAGVPLSFIFFVGWVERSETHREIRGGLRRFAANPSTDRTTDRTRISLRCIRATGYGPFVHRCLTTLARCSRRENGIALPALRAARGERASPRFWKMGDKKKAKPRGRAFPRGKCGRRSRPWLLFLVVLVLVDDNLLLRARRGEEGLALFAFLDDGGLAGIVVFLDDRGVFRLRGRNQLHAHDQSRDRQSVV